MTNFNLLQKNLTAIQAKWTSFDDVTKKQKINLFLPFVQLASFLNVLEPESNQAFLQNFALDYQRLYDQDISQMNASDLSPQLFARLHEVQNGGAELSAKEKAELLKYEDKYVHAHSRAMFNYGAFMNISRQVLSAEKQQQLADKIAALKTFDSSQDLEAKSDESAQDMSATLQLLSEINHDFEIEKHSALIPKDDLENHALLNQMTSYALNISQTATTLLDENLFLRSQEILDVPAKKLQTKRASVNHDLSGSTAQLANSGIEMTVGLESEFLLNPLDKKSVQPTPTQENIAIKKILADINARRKMQLKYGFEATLPEIESVTPFLSAAADFNHGIGLANYRQISRDLEKRLGKAHADLPQLQERVQSFTEAETFFYKLFFLENFAAENKIELDGLFHPSESAEETFAKVLPLIANGRFHEHLLDMIQAHEIAVGPFELSEIIAQKNSAFEKMRLLANQSGVSLDDANVQVNSAFTLEFANGAKAAKVNILLPRIFKDANGETRIEFNELGRKFLELMEEAVAELGSVPGILRQSTVNTSFDRNKFVGPQLKGTPFRQVDDELPAFLNHKFLAAKNTPLRLSLINSDLAVVELRLVGNNTHFAKFPEAQTSFHSGIDFIAEEFLPKVASKIAAFTAGKSAAELAELYKQKIVINHDGKIANLAPTTAAKFEMDHDYDLSTQEKYDPRKPSSSVALVSYQEPLSLTATFSAAAARSW